MFQSNPSRRLQIRAAVGIGSPCMRQSGSRTLRIVPFILEWDSAYSRE